MSEDRLTQKDIALAKARMKYIAANKNKKKTQDRLTQEDIETYQNDRTQGLPQEAYEQEDQTISNEAPKMNHGGEVRGGGSAIRGKGFKGVF